jgi:hypothetical protein
MEDCREKAARRPGRCGVGRAVVSVRGASGHLLVGRLYLDLQGTAQLWQALAGPSPPARASQVGPTRLARPSRGSPSLAARASQVGPTPLARPPLGSGLLPALCVALVIVPRDEERWPFARRRSRWRAPAPEGGQYPPSRNAAAGARLAQNWTLPLVGGGAGRAGAGLTGRGRGGGSLRRTTGTTTRGGGGGAAFGTRGGISHPPVTISAAAVPLSRIGTTRANAIDGIKIGRRFGRRILGDTHSADCLPRVTEPAVNA